MSDERYDGSEIAVIGFAGRFPGARNVDELWQNLKAGRDTIRHFSADELRAAGVGEELLRDPAYVTARGVLDEIESFDAAFFGYSPREAEVMDPQQRLFLECAWDAFEHAGYDPASHSGLIGVFAGVNLSTYLLSHLYSKPELRRSVIQVQMGNDKDYLANRVSYKLNLRGPSFTVQSACSSSLVALHLARQSLFNEECDLALAGGVSIQVPQETGYLYQEDGILSPDGRCRAFDAEAAGTVFSNGVAIVVLKRLADALRDGDDVFAVIRGSAVNNDGALKAAYTAPSIDGQAEVIVEALGDAGVDAGTISYVETHGTATALGDPIEIAALTRAFRLTTQDTSFCALGAVKSNVGHLSMAAGVTGLIKTCLMLKHRTLVPSAHFQRPNPGIDFAGSPFYVNADLREWPDGPGRRRAGVSAFGFGGTNAHVVLEEAPAVAGAEPSRAWQLLVLSARSPEALDERTRGLARHLEEHPDVALADVAFTLQVGRRPFPHRRTLVCQDRRDALAALASPDSERLATAVAVEDARRPPLFLFPGQGAQYAGMGLDLYRQEPIFREQVNRCCEILKPHLGRDLREVLYPGDGERGPDIDQTSLAQPALFAVEWALARLWMGWGIRPAALIGHSIGELTAACLAGVFSLEDALSLVAARGRLMQSMQPGAMLAVLQPEAEVRSLLGDGVELAAVNGPALCVVAGPADAIDRIAARLAAKSMASHRLHTSHAFHTASMEPILEPFREQVARCRLRPPEIPLISNLTGTWITDEQATDPHYWATHLRRPVRFNDGLTTLLAKSDWVMLEVGPGKALSDLAGKRLLARQRGIGPGSVVAGTSIRHPRDRTTDLRLLLETLGKLWLAGIGINGQEFHAGERRRRVHLPSYPFERRRYWVERGPAGLPADRQPGAATRREGAGFTVPVWRQSPSPVPVAAADSGRLPARWWVFLHGPSGEGGLGGGLVRRLRALGREVTTITAGASFARRGDGEYTFDCRSADDYRTLLRELPLPQRILHLGGLAGGSGPPEESMGSGFFSLLLLARALLGHGAPELGIEILTDGVFDVTGAEELRPLNATLLGACLVVPQELPQVRCRLVDVVPPEPGSRRQEELLDQLIAELTAPAAETPVAYRGPHRWVRGCEPLRADSEVFGGNEKGLRRRGVYAVTGALDELGLAVARLLAGKAGARLALLDTPHRVAALGAGAVAELTGLGAEVMVVEADPGEPAQVRAAVAAVRQRFGGLHGVVHAAPGLSGRLISEETPETAAAVLMPKVRGALAFDEALGESAGDLDFFLLLSSIGSLAGGPGRIAECAADAFLDALAHQRRSRLGGKALAVNLGIAGWSRRHEAAAASRPELAAHLGQLRESFGMGLEETAAALVRLLPSHLPQVTVSAVEIAAAREQYGTYPEAAGGRQEEVAGAPGRYPRPDLRTSYVAPASAVEKDLAEVWENVLGVDKVGIHDSFFELGGDSLLALQVLEELKKKFSVEIEASSLFEGPTIHSLARIMSQDEPSEMSAAAGDDRGARRRERLARRKRAR